MKKYNNILVVAEPKREVQNALIRALDMTQFNPKATVTYLRIVYDYESDIMMFKDIMNKQQSEATEELYEEAMQKIIEDYRMQANSETTVLTKIIKSKDIAQSIVKEINTGKYDLVIKAANNHGILDSILFTPIDWYILRKSIVPVIITKDSVWTEGGNIVICTDFSATNQDNLNLSMLREAQVLAKITKTTIHLVNAAPIYFPSIMLEVPQYSPSEYGNQVFENHKKMLLEFAAKHHIAEKNCHIEEGMPDEVIPKLCQALNAKYVFIGSAGRSGIMATLVGNTCEEIVDEIDADLFVMTHKYLQNK